MTLKINGSLSWIRRFAPVVALMFVATAVQSAETLIPARSVWRYSPDGTDQGTVWRQPGFNDSAWPAGPGPLGFGDAHIVTVLPPGRVTYYFRRIFNVSNPADVSALTAHLLRDDGAVVYLNGVEVFRSNMPGGPVSFNTLATSAVGGADETTYFSSAVPPSLLVAGVNVVAVEVHQNVFTSSDLGFDLALVAETAPPANPPDMVSATTDCSSQIVVTFDEPVDPVSSQDPGNYLVQASDGGFPAVVQVTAGSDAQSVVLTVDQALTPDQTYAVYSDNICDLEGDCSSPQNVGLTFDDTAPTVECAVSVAVLSPPNHAMVDVGLNASSNDPDIQIQVYSDEPAGPGGDAQLNAGVLTLRASRDGGSDGRVYLVLVTSTDACGNVGSCCSTVVVPHNASPVALAAVLAQAAAAQSQCNPAGSSTTPHQILP